jgi:hypothetical protein
MAAAAVAAQAAGALPPLPPHLAAGAAGRGFVLDGFPATQAQAALLEQALTGLDLAAETALHTHASRLAPPPLSRLPQLARPLVSGLDAVLLLECGDVELAVARVLGCRLDPVTGAQEGCWALEAGAQLTCMLARCHVATCCAHAFAATTRPACRPCVPPGL